MKLLDFIKFKIDQYQSSKSLEEDLFEMANLRKTETGLPVNIYVSSGGSVNKRHGPRVKVMYQTSDKFDPHATVSVMLKKDLQPTDVIGYSMLDTNTFKAIKRYLDSNYQVLIDYWNDKISTSELLLKLKKL